MKREVAEEWMNRYLDGDLSEEDADILFRHIDNNPDDADTFRIMSALSLQLEKLPDVKPRFSLVDSILPTLDDIDAERRAEIASDIGIMEPQHESKDEFTERRRQRSSWRDRLPVRTIGGLVAAGVILGVSIATYEPKTLSDAGQAPTSISMEQQAAEQEKGAAKSNAEQDATLQAPVTNTPESTTSPESNTQSQSDQSPETTVPDSGTLDSQATPPDKATPDTGTGTSQESTPSSGNKGGNPPASSQTGPEASPPSSSSDPSSNQDQLMKQQEIAPNTDSSGTSESSSATGTDSGTTDSSSSNSSKSSDSTTPSTANNDESSSTVAPKSSADDSSSKDSSSSKDNASSTTPDTSDSDVAPKTYSIAPETDAKPKDDKLRSFSTNTIQQEQEWVSPTSQFAVVLTTSNTLRLDSLSKNNINGRTVVATATIDGTWLNGQWTKDGKAFNYQVAKEGKTKWYKLSTAGLQ
ncbi:hypothetical protein PaeCFBP13512_02130 [Paenibacillus sp. CFBP13512]|uniref:anti-sigma factor family protein n=1 Tax=Paenibacillus sp. CFBP13512 TaxID=2184007 RepID=UPI0010C0B6AA|nr:hypothetical protein [Paenibacillus sp. CFBP13512]TKJ94321.1 hypothetical protein PaeCFBP13512_02130 [Paenibacillus sp. CFBP13512]